jgi:hypothetical protein
MQAAIQKLCFAIAALDAVSAVNPKTSAVNKAATQLNVSSKKAVAEKKVEKKEVAKKTAVSAKKKADT